MINRFFLLFFVTFSILNAAYKDTTACRIYPLISEKAYETESKKFLTNICHPFHDINSSMFAGEFGIKYRFSCEEKIQIKEFLDKRTVAVVSILDGNEDALDSERELFVDTSKKLYWNLFVSKKVPTLFERMALSYPVCLSTIFKYTAFTAKISDPHIKEMTLSQGFWKGNLRFAKAIKKIL